MNIEHLSGNLFMQVFRVLADNTKMKKKQYKGFLQVYKDYFSYKKVL